MSLYYPQGAVILRVVWEDFDTGEAVLQEVTDMQIACKSIEVNINDYAEADTFRCVVDYNALPLDPRCIRAMGVSIFLEDMKSIFKDGVLNLIKPSEDNKILVGFVDEGSIQFDDETRTMEIEGRDFTSLFIDKKRVDRTHIPLSKPVDQVIQDLINEQEATATIEVVNRTGEDFPVLSKLAPDLNEATGVKNQRRKTTYWDIIQEIVRRVGVVGYVELDKFILDKPQNIYVKKEFKQFIWGKNIKNLSFKRKLGRNKNFNVRIISPNITAKSVLEAKIPFESTTLPNKGTEVTIPQLDKDGKKVDPPKTADYITFRVPDISDKETLIKIGESVYEEMSRQQIEGHLKTFEMEIPQESGNQKNGVFSTEPISFAKMKNGSAIKIMFSGEELTKINSKSNEREKEQFLRDRGYPITIAKAFASSLNKINTPFYVKGVSFMLDQENGFEMDVNFINFIDIDVASIGQ